MKRQLPLVATIIAIYKITCDHLRYAVRIVLPWYIFLLLLFVTSLFLAGDQPVSVSMGVLLSGLVSFVAWCAIAVLWHRRLLRGEEIAGALIWLDHRTWRYLLRFVAIGLIFLVPIFVVVVAASLIFDDISDHISLMISIPAVVVGMIITLRLSVALPAVALDVSKISFGDAWRATDGNSIRLFIISIITTTPFVAAEWLLSLIMEPGGDLGFSARLALLESFRLAIELSSVLIGVTLLSLSYAFLVENQAAGTTMTTS